MYGLMGGWMDGWVDGQWMDEWIFIILLSVSVSGKVDFFL